MINIWRWNSIANAVKTFWQISTVTVGFPLTVLSLRLAGTDSTTCSKNDWLKVVSTKDINAIFRTCSKCTHAQIDTTICNKDQDTGPTASGFPSKAQALLPLTLQVIHAITNQEPFELGKDAQKEITCWQSKTQLKRWNASFFGQRRSKLCSHGQTLGSIHTAVLVHLFCKQTHCWQRHVQ